MTRMQLDEAVKFLTQGTAQIVSEAELREKLKLNRPLRVKLGVDPTSPDIHLGHSVVLRKLRQFQDLGHQAVLIIGDFTAMIGDPSGRSVTRPQLTHEQVMENAQTYTDQAMKILDRAHTEIVFNGNWLKKMTFQDVIQLNSRVTLQQILQREDFRTRLEKQQPIHAHEIQYPLMQGWDSVMVKADVELGGTDQLFNILVGRDLQRGEGLPQQIVMLLPILEGLDGEKKMSKSLGNHIAVNEPPNEMFGKLMSISDKMMADYYVLLLARELPAAMHALEAKKQLACEITATYHTPEIAQKTLEDWNQRFSERRLAEAELPGFSSNEPIDDAVAIVVAAYERSFGITKSRADARRLITQGSVQLDGEKVTDPKSRFTLRPGQVLRLDKTHAVRIT
jgi:tyrosyl-tRNA synthetase